MGTRFKFEFIAQKAPWKRKRADICYLAIESLGFVYLDVTSHIFYCRRYMAES